MSGSTSTRRICILGLSRALSAFSSARARSRLLKRTHLITGLLVLLCSSEALAELMLYPTRIVFEGNQRAAQLELINNGSESATYRITLVNRRMDETGSFSDIEEPQPGEQFADSMLRYSPRQVTLAPGAGQAIRIMVRKPADIAVGEYRSHLKFTQLPDARGSTSIEAQGGDGNGIDIMLNVLVGASIPVIVRHGNTHADAALTHLELQRPASGQSFISVHMERSGNQSVYGDLVASFTPQGGTERVIGRANGVAVYAPNPLRRVIMAVEPPANAQLAKGALKVMYREQAADGGDVLAEATLQLP